MAAGIIAIARKALETEIFAAALYGHLAQSYPDRAVRGAFAEVAAMEKGHVVFWSGFLNKRGVDAAGVKSSPLRVAFYKLMLRLVGKGLTLRMMESSESQAIETYSSLHDSPALSDEERRSLNGILSDELVHENLFTEEESRLGDVTAYIKDAVLGMSDGLVETLSVATGLAGASGQPMTVAVSGLVVGIAGALSMGVSTYASTRSQRQVHEGIIKRIVLASKFVGHIFKERVLKHFERQGYSSGLSREVSEESARDPRLLSSFLAEREYGIREENPGSPLKAALYAGFSNLLGGLVPLIPYFLAAGIVTALTLSVALATIALAVTGFFVSVLAYMPPGRKIGEIVLSGLGCAAVTYGIGWAAGVLLGAR